MRCQLCTLRCILVAAALLLIPSGGKAQLTNNTGDVATPIPGAGHDYIKMVNETVNPATGSVSLQIDIPIPPGRGITIPFSIQYSSSGILQPYVGNPNTGEEWLAFSNGQTGTGWVYSIPSLTAIEYLATFNDTSVRPPRTESCDWISSYMFQAADASRHRLDISIAQQAGGSTFCGSGVAPRTNVLTGGDPVYQAATTNPYGINQISSPSPVTVASPDGTIYTFSSFAATALGPTTAPGNGTGFYARTASVEDRNGNIVNISTATSGAITETDSVGRTAVSVSAVNSNQNTITVSGISTPYTIQWESKPSNFTTGTQEIESPLLGGACATGIAANPQSLTVIQSITLPNGQSYQFGYDGTYGLLNYIKYPTGGTVSYTWNVNALSESTYWIPLSSGTPPTCVMEYGVPAITKRVVSFDGVNAALEQDFSYNTSWTSGYYNWQTKQTTVITKDLITNTSFETVYNYVPMGTGIPVNNNGYIYVWPSTPVETSVVQYADLGTTILKTTTKGWLNQYDLGCEFTTLGNLGTPGTSGTFYAYSRGSQITDKAEYDFNLLPSSSCSNGAAKPSSPIATRDTTYTYQSFPVTPIFPSGQSIFDRPSTAIISANVNGSQTSVAETDYLYDQNTVTSAVTAAGTHDETNYAAGSTAPRANATTITRKCLQNCADSVIKLNYDETGKVLAKIDPCGNTTCSDMSGTNHTITYSYTDNFDSPPSSNTNAYLTQITDPLGHISKFKYAYSDGQLIQSQNQNDINASRTGTTYTYNDSLRRLTETDYSDGGQTTISYNDSAPSPSVTTSQKVNTSPLHITNVATMDGVGHVVQTALTTDPDSTTYTATLYDGLSQTYKSYNPTRCSTPTTNCGESTWGYTTYAYDALGRTTSITAPDGNVTSNSYSGACTTTTDPAGKSRKACTDGLSRLTQVLEDPANLAYETDYAYDALNNLLTVNQKGGSSSSANWRTRTFTYDSLSRLTSSINPESNTIPSSTTTVATTYTYDANGNLSSKTSPAQNQQSTSTVTLSYCYDALNRLTGKAYASQSCPLTSPVATYIYDQGAASINPIGHRTGMTDQAGSEAWSYDSMGRVTTDQRTTEGISKTTTYTYNLDGSLATILYPSSNPETLAYAAGGAGRPVSLIGTMGSTSVGYANPVHYAPSGAVCYLASGWGATFYHTYLFNNRLQPTRISVITNLPGPTQPCATPTQNGNMFDISYNYVDANNHNNGNVVSIANNLNSYRSQNFTYDSLNRLATAQTSSTYATSSANCWAETYTYDAWGNLYQYGANATTQSAYVGCSQESGLNSSSAPLVTNRLPNFCYDSAGNLVFNATCPNQSFIPNFVYDAENHLVSTSMGGLTYLYDGDGKRVGKAPSSTPTQPTTIYWYGSGSDPLFETNGSGTFTYTHYYFNGQRVSMRTPTNWVNHYVYDALGNARIVYGQNGAWSQSDFYPFGGERVIGTGADNSFKFTGKERDSESGLDNFGARYYASTLGRFASPDPRNAGAKPESPQSWNAYSYVGNNPVNRIDPTGLLWEELKNWFRWGVYVKNDQVEPALQKTADEDRAALGNGNITYKGNLLTRKYLNSLSNKQVYDLTKAYTHALAEGNVGAQINTKNGVVLVGAMEGHHFFPRATEFRQYFDAADIDVENYIVNMPADLHRQLPDGLHTGTGRGGNWNQAWRDFFRQNPNATQEQIFREGEELIQEFPIIEPYVPENFLPKEGEGAEP